MRSGNSRGNMLSALENGFDMIINLIAMLIGYLFAILVTGTGSDSFTSTIIVSSAIIASSLIYQACEAAAYAATYPIALIAVVLVSQFLIIIF